MSATKKILCLFSNLFVQGVVFFSCSVIAYPQKLQSIDSVNTKDTFSSKTIQKSISSQKPSENFYKTDSIFSFRSQKGYFPSLLHNFGEQATAPFHFKTKQWLITGAAIGITAALIHVDNEIDDWAKVQKQKHNWVNKSSPVITGFGANYSYLSVASIGLISASFKNQKGVQTSLLATQALITSGFWAQLIKNLTGREDPRITYTNSKLEGGKWYGPFAQYDQDLAIKKPTASFDAFPSGHTAAAFSIATVFASQYSNIKAIPIISYSMATLVGISRLTEHQHWASDVFVGGLLGYVCGRQVVAHYNKTHQNAVSPIPSKSKIKTELTLIQYENQVGFYLRW